eukprot:COSAG01_NODE_1290_length_10882_cov_25.926922_7_plen_206_part_00
MKHVSKLEEIEAIPSGPLESRHAQLAALRGGRAHRRAPRCACPPRSTPRPMLVDVLLVDARAGRRARGRRDCATMGRPLRASAAAGESRGSRRGGGEAPRGRVSLWRCGGGSLPACAVHYSSAAGQPAASISGIADCPSIDGSIHGQSRPPPQTQTAGWEVALLFQQQQQEPDSGSGEVRRLDTASQEGRRAQRASQQPGGWPTK